MSMPLRSPNLDDRTFQQLVDEAKTRIQQHCPAWSDLSPGDPGIVLLEAFAYLTEVMIYRLNRIPEKAYVEFLNLLGLKLQPPVAADTSVLFTRSRATDQPLDIPKGTRVTTARPPSSGTPPVFVTAERATIPPGQVSVETRAYHAEYIEAERLGLGTGRPRLSFTTLRHPIVASSEALKLIVGVEALPEELTPQMHTIEFRGKAYRVWKEVENFTNIPSGELPFIVDRITGTITFAPALRIVGPGGRLDEFETPIAPVPADKREIRCWYWCGGGPEGNVAPATLTVLKDPIPGVSVTNPKAAMGGLSAETLDNAIVRGPLEFNSLKRCVTASDFELLARRSSGAVDMAKAITEAEIWTHAVPGTVDVLLVPRVPEPPPPDQPLTSDILHNFQSDQVLHEIRALLDERRPLGTMCKVDWASYKSVSVRARVVVFREQDPEMAKTRVMTSLYKQINPTFWRFGETLRSSHIYQLILREPGISYVDKIALRVDSAPENNVTCLTRDLFQPHAWYAGRADTLFRSTNDAEGWEAVGHFPNQQVRLVVAHPRLAGWVAVATLLPDGHYQLHITSNCGESWTAGSITAFDIQGMAWMLREGEAVLLLATSVGLYEYTPGPDADPRQIEVDPAVPDLGFFAVQVITDARGGSMVAVAAQDGQHGVYLCADFARSRTFTNVGLQKEDVRVLAVNNIGPRTYLWAGFGSTGEDPGKAAARVELIGQQLSAEGWVYFSQGWQGRTCWSLAFRDTKVFAASQRSGVVVLDTLKPAPVWEEPDKRSGLPLDSSAARLFLRISAVRVDPKSGLLLCGCAEGVFMSQDGGTSYQLCSSREYSDKVTLPDTWLFCSSKHEIEVVSEDDATGD
jgi:hypothetical protein